MGKGKDREKRGGRRGCRNERVEKREGVRKG